MNAPAPSAALHGMAKPAAAANQGLLRHLPGLSALASYEPAWLGADLVAGVSVAAVAVPVAIAYSQLAGAPPVYGLYSSILPLVAYALFGTSRQLVVAPDAATCAIVAAVTTPLAMHDPSRYAALMAALSILTGLLCIAGGAARLGFLTNFLARPILSGYLNGIAVSIVIGQMGKLFGFPLHPAGFFRMAWEFLSEIGATHGATLATGAATFALLRVLRHVSPKIPGPLVAVALGIAASTALDLGGRGVALLGAIPAGLPPLALPAVRWADVEALAAGAVGLALISFNSAMVTARGFAVKNRYEIDANREFVALGVADIGSGLMGGFAVSGADSRTAVNDAVGGKSQVTGLVAAALVALVLVFLTGPLAALPVAVLAAVLVHSALGLLDLPGIATLRRVSPKEFRLSLVTFLGVITVGVLQGVAVAIGVALVQILVRASSPREALLGRLPGTDGYVDTAMHPEAETFPGLLVYRFESAILFFNADHFKSRLRAVAGATEGLRTLVLDLESSPGIDTTGAACLAEAADELREKGIALAVAEAVPSVRELLDAAGVTGRIGADRFFPTIDAAVAALAPSSRPRAEKEGT